MRTHKASKTDYNAMPKMDIRHYAYLISSTVFVIQELLNHLYRRPVYVCAENLAIPAMFSFKSFNIRFHHLENILIQFFINSISLLIKLTNCFFCKFLFCKADLFHFFLR